MMKISSIALPNCEIEGSIPLGKIYFCVQLSAAVTLMLPPMVWMKAKPARLQAAVRNLHILAVVFIPDVFHDTDRDDRVILTLHFAVILQPQLHRQPFAAFHPQGNLFFGNGHPQDARAVFFRGIFGEAAPSTAEFKHMHALFKPDLAANQIEFGLLSLIQIAASSQ